MTKSSDKSKRPRIAKLPDAVTGADSPSGRFWTQWIKPRGSAFLAQMLGPVYFVIKNHGSNNVMLTAHHGDLMDISPGAVRATYAHGTITVENRGEDPALIEFDFLPILKT